MSAPARTLRALIAPAPMKGALAATEVAAALVAGLTARLERTGVKLETRSCPLADGGEGTIEALLAATPGAPVDAVEITDAFGARTRGRILWLDEGTALVQSADAVGIGQLAKDARDPFRASSHGVGELVLAARARGARRVRVALGGTATVDGGLGLLVALGARARAADGRLLAGCGSDLMDLEVLDLAPARAAVAGLELFALVDVDCPLLGPGGAAMFMAQKGVAPSDVPRFEAGLRRLASLTDPRHVDAAGAGAAGGLGFALLALGAASTSGAEAVLAAHGIDDGVAWADVVLTAEGSFDAQTARGKAVGRVLARAEAAGKPAVVVVGRREAPSEGLATVVTLADGAASEAELMASAGARIEDLAFELGGVLSTLARTRA